MVEAGDRQHCRPAGCRGALSLRRTALARLSALGLEGRGGLSLAVGFAHSPEVGTLALVSRGARPAPAVRTCAPRERRKSVRSLPRPAVPFGLPGLRFRPGAPLRPRRLPSVSRSRRSGLPDPSLRRPPRAPRRACPVGAELRYSAEQSSFHMRAFMGGRFG